jgi:hypothetical protein
VRQPRREAAASIRRALMAGGLLLVVRSGSRRLSAKLRAQQATWGIVDAGVFVRGRGASR